MSFVDVEIPTQKNKRFEGTPKNQRELHNKVTKEHLNHIPVFNETAHSAVTFAPDVQTNVVNSLLPFLWMSKNASKYLIISDSEESDTEEDHQARVEHNSKNDQVNKPREMSLTTTTTTTTTTEKNENDVDPVIKNEQLTFRDKLSTITKDIGHFFTHPNTNIRQFFRRREGYLPPDQRLIQETTLCDMHVEMAFRASVQNEI